MNTRAIYFKDGKHLTIEEEEFYAVKKEILSGKKFIHVQNTLISVDGISRIGSHEGTAEMIRREEGNSQVGLPYDQKLLSVRKLKEKMVVLPAKLERLGGGSAAMTSEEDERGDAMFWVDNEGIKHYD